MINWWPSHLQHRHAQKITIYGWSIRRWRLVGDARDQARSSRDGLGWHGFMVLLAGGSAQQVLGMALLPPMIAVTSPLWKMKARLPSGKLTT